MAGRGYCGVRDVLEDLVASTLCKLCIGRSCHDVLYDLFLVMVVILPPTCLLVLWDPFETNWVLKCFVVLQGKLIF